MVGEKGEGSREQDSQVSSTSDCKRMEPKRIAQSLLKTSRFCKPGNCAKENEVLGALTTPLRKSYCHLFFY